MLLDLREVSFPSGSGVVCTLASVSLPWVSCPAPSSTASSARLSFLDQSQPLTGTSNSVKKVLS